MFSNVNLFTFSSFWKAGRSVDGHSDPQVAMDSDSRPPQRERRVASESVCSGFAADCFVSSVPSSGREMERARWRM